MDEVASGASKVDLKSGSERRMINQVAAYWEEIKGDRHFPSMTDIEPTRLDGIRSNCFVLDVSESIENPIVRFVGEMLSEGGTVAQPGDPLTGVSKRSLFGRVSEHFLECVANGAPVGIEAEYDNDKGEAILYRGVVVPFSDDNEHIDFVLGAISFKYKAEEAAADAPAAVSPAAAVEPVEIAEMADAADASQPDPKEAAALLDTLSRCRHLARQAHESMNRSREALYTALAEAYGFRFDAEAAPDAYAAILAEVEIEAQERAPYTPIVKLVFGAEYDKTRISEYAATLAYGLRMSVPREDFKSFLENQEGGIKACVAAERAARRAERGEAWDSIAYARSILRDQPPLAHLDDIEVDEDEEFVLILARREANGHGVEIVKLLHEKPALVDGIIRRAAIGIPNPAADTADDSVAAANENAPFDIGEDAPPLRKPHGET